MAGATEGLRKQADELVHAVSIFRLQGGSAQPLQSPALATQRPVIHGSPRPAVAAPASVPVAARSPSPALAPSAAAAPAAARAASMPSKAKVAAATADDDWETF